MTNSLGSPVDGGTRAVRWAGIAIGVVLLVYVFATDRHVIYSIEVGSLGTYLGYVCGILLMAWGLHRSAEHMGLSVRARLLGILGLGVIVRTVMWHYFPYWGGSDADDYVRIAKLILENGLLQAPVIRPVGTSLLFALSYKVFGISTVGPLVVNLLAGIASIALVYGITKNISHNDNAGLLAALFFAFYTRSIAFARITNSDELCIPFLLASLYCFLLYADTRKIEYYVGLFLCTFLGMHIRYSLTSVAASLFLIEQLMSFFVVYKIRKADSPENEFRAFRDALLRYFKTLGTWVKYAIIAFLFILLVYSWHFKVRYISKMPGFLAASQYTMLYVGNNPYADGTGRYDMAVYNYFKSFAVENGYDMSKPGETPRVQGILAKKFITEADLATHLRLVKLRAWELFFNPTWYRGTQFEQICTYLGGFFLLGVYFLLSPFMFIRIRNKEGAVFFLNGILSVFVVFPALLTVGAPRYSYPAYPLLLIADCVALAALARTRPVRALRLGFADGLVALCCVYLVVVAFALPGTVRQLDYGGVNVTFGQMDRWQKVAQSFRARKASYSSLQFEVNEIKVADPGPTEVLVMNDNNGKPGSKILGRGIIPGGEWKQRNLANERDLRTIPLELILEPGRRYWIILQTDGPLDVAGSNLAGTDRDPLCYEQLLFWDGRQWWESCGGKCDLYFVLS